MSVIDKKKIVRSSITQAGVPVLFDEIISGEVKIQDSKSVSYVENGEYSVVPDAGFDAVAQVNVTVDVQPVTSFEGTKVFDSLDQMTELNSYDVKGALVSYDGSHYTVWNGDSTAAGYWNPDATDGAEPSDQYGNILAVCVGKGIWVAKDWKGLDTTNLSLTIEGSTSEQAVGYMCFCPQSEDENSMYQTYISECVKGSGKDNTSYIFNHFTDEITAYNHEPITDGETFASWTDYYAALTPMWEQILKTNTSGLKPWTISNGQVTQEGSLYIPNKMELQDINWSCSDNVYDEQFLYDNNLAQLLGLSADFSYWSSSQYTGDTNGVFSVNFGNGSVESNAKDHNYLSVACVHFH